MIHSRECIINKQSCGLFYFTGKSGLFTYIYSDYAQFTNEIKKALWTIRSKAPLLFISYILT